MHAGSGREYGNTAWETELRKQKQCFCRGGVGSRNT